MEKEFYKGPPGNFCEADTFDELMTGYVSWRLGVVRTQKISDVKTEYTIGVLNTSVTYEKLLPSSKVRIVLRSDKMQSMSTLEELLKAELKINR